MARDVHRCGTVDYQQIENDNIANQIHRFIIDYGKFILNWYIAWNILSSNIVLRSSGKELLKNRISLYVWIYENGAEEFGHYHTYFTSISLLF